MKFNTLLVATSAALLTSIAAANGSPAGELKLAQATSAAAAEMTDAEVRKIDLEGGKVTLKHAEIKSLDMPGMTMVFVVKDKAMLEKLKPGDKVKFKAINDSGKYTVTELQSAQ